MVLDSKSSSTDRIQEISMVLTRSFIEDPFYKYIIPNEGMRFKVLSWWMICMVRYGCEYGQIHISDKPNTGVAIWLKPDNPLISNLAMARMGMIEAPLRLGIRGFYRMMKISDEWEHLHKKESLHHWYLLVLGVDPPYQGRGIGSSLIQPVLKKADQERIPCYLETMTQRDVVFYRQRGFNIVVEGKVGDQIPYWTMRRSPKS